MRVSLPSGTAAELALPSGDATRGLVLAPDIGGLRPLFDDLCAQLARDHGWAVCAPEPFAGRETLEVPERLGVVGELDDDRQLGDLLAAAERLESEAGVDRVAVLGFCMGGMYALKAAGIGRFDRAVAFYGMIRIPEQWQSASQGEPLSYLERDGAAPTLAIIGGLDGWTPPADVDALRSVGSHVDVVVYDDAEHGFAHDPSRPAHRAQDAADAWAKSVDFLA
ncbi:MAG: dienelactone hydrolase family protein [Acidimicrobiales bacterium]